MLDFAGIGDGATDEGSPAARVVALETRLAGHHWDNVATRDAVKSYNPFGYAALEGLAPTLGWDDLRRLPRAPVTPSRTSSWASPPTSRGCRPLLDDT